MNLTLRHFVGGFVGGSIGILALHFAGFWMMLAASIIGFITGFWAQEIWRDLHKPLVLPEKFGGAWLAQLNSRSQESLTEARKKINWMFSLPQRFCAWISESPENRSWLTSWIVAALWVVCVFWTTRRLIADDPWDYVIHWPWFTAFLVSLVGVGIGLVSGTKENSRPYRWSKGVVRFAFIEAFKIAYSGIVFTSFAAATIAIYLSGTICLPFVQIALYLAQSVTNLILSISTLSTKKAHWMGAVVTVITTTTTALFAKGQMSDQTVLLIAFANGTASGLLSMGAHRLSKWLATVEKIVRFTKWSISREDVRGLPDAAFERLGVPVLKVLLKPLHATL